MAYTAVPAVVTGQTYLASDYNSYVKDNMSALWPYTSSGDISYATSSSTLTRLGIGSSNQVLTVESGAPKWKTPSSGVSLDQVYPVGSLYMSTISTSPATLFGIGTWVAIEGQFILAANSTYPAGTTGGAATHTLTSSEMPSHTHTDSGHAHSISHTHTYNIPYGNTRIGTGASEAFEYPYTTGATTSAPSSANSGTGNASIQNTGGGAAHNNMPPYLAVYVWKRTA